jgi:tetratricopeptide (TPR) repeat protein
MKAICVLVLLTRVAIAEPSNAQVAAQDNNEGKDLMFANKPKEAAAKFRDAADRDPQATYYFNLCTALYQKGVFGAALSACKVVATLHPTAKIATKTETTIKRIISDATAQNVDLNPVEPTRASLDDAGKDLMFAGKYQAAAEQFRKATALEPTAGHFHNLCLALYQSGQFAQANTACRAALAHKPSVELRAKIDKYLRLIHDDAAAQHIALVATPEPGSPADFAMVANQQGEALREHDLDAARLQFRDAVAHDPQASYFYNLCAVDAALGKPDEAADACKAVLTHKPSAALKTKANALLAASPGG